MKRGDLRADRFGQDDTGGNVARQHFASEGHGLADSFETAGVSFPKLSSCGVLENSRLFNYAGHYYQQRFEFADATT